MPRPCYKPTCRFITDGRRGTRKTVSQCVSSDFRAFCGHVPCCIQPLSLAFGSPPCYVRPLRFYRASSTVLAVIVYLSVCPSQVRIVQRRLNLGSHKQRHTIAQGLVFRCQNLNEITPNRGAKYRRGRFESAIFHQYLAISQKRCKIET